MRASYGKRILMVQTNHVRSTQRSCRIHLPVMLSACCLPREVGHLWDCVFRNMMIGSTNLILTFRATSSSRLNSPTAFLLQGLCPVQDVRDAVDPRKARRFSDDPVRSSHLHFIKSNVSFRKSFIDYYRRKRADLA